MVLTTPIITNMNSRRAQGRRRRRRRGVNNNALMPKELRPVQITNEEILKNQEMKQNIENRKKDRIQDLNKLINECNNAMGEIKNASKDSEESIAEALEKLDMKHKEGIRVYQAHLEKSKSITNERRKSVSEELSDMRIRARTRSQERLHFILMKNGLDVDVPFPPNSFDLYDLISLQDIMDPYAGESLAYPDNNNRMETMWNEVTTLIDPFMKNGVENNNYDGMILHPNDNANMSLNAKYDKIKIFDPFNNVMTNINSKDNNNNENDDVISYPETKNNPVQFSNVTNIEDPYDYNNNNNNNNDNSNTMMIIGNDSILYPIASNVNNDYFANDLLDPYENNSETSTNVTIDTKTTVNKSTTKNTTYSTPKDRLVAFYTSHCPDKLPKVDKNLKKYSGREEVLWGMLYRKYKEKFIPFAPAEMLVKRKDIKYGRDDNTKVYFEIAIDGKKMSSRIIIQLFDHIVPKTCENFRALCTGEKGIGTKGKPLHYKNCVIHRIIKGFMIQGGDITNGNGTGGESIYVSDASMSDMVKKGKMIDENFTCRHIRAGMLSMANSGPNSNTSQFFITLSETPHLDMKHVVFGEVVVGLECIEELGSCSTNAKGNKPVQNVRIVDCGEC